MATNIAASIVDRWSSAGLDDSIAVLYRGTDDDLGYGSTPEDTDDAELPRAEFVTFDDEPVVNTIGFKLREVPVALRVYARSMSQIEDWLDLIESVFDFSDQTEASPTALETTVGHITECQQINRRAYPLDKDAAFGEVMLSITWQKPVAIPV